MEIKDKEMFEKFKYILMLNMDLKELEELETLYPNDEVIKSFKNEIIRLNNDEEFIREIREEEENMMLFKQEGIEEGIDNEKNNIIRNLLKMNTSIEKVAQVTNLTKKEVKERIKKYNLKE